VTFGLGGAAEWRASNVEPNDAGGSDFFVYVNDHPVGQFHLQVPGRHNVANALAASVAAGRVGVDLTTAAEALAGFTGVGRRLERIGEAGGVAVFDDYAHHPTKVRASLAGLREHHPGRIVCLFQPHHYHRLSSLFEDFARAFGDADLVVLADVYQPAGRGPEAGERTAVDLAAAIAGPEVAYAGTLADAAREVARQAQTGDLVVTMGAGDVTNAGPELLRLLAERTSR
jgi:UDP-N-acetylmuramate--alanine ligase